jgi:hypothetical protein
VPSADSPPSNNSDDEDNDDSDSRRSSDGDEVEDDRFKEEAGESGQAAPKGAEETLKQEVGT